MKHTSPTLSRVLRLLLTVIVVSVSNAALFGTAALAHPGHDEHSDLTERVEAGGAPLPGSGPLIADSFVRAIDGDTMELWLDKNQIAIGIIGIDAPEGNTVCGVQATGFLQSLSYGGLRFEEDAAFTFDDASRRMYYAYTPDGQSVAELVVAAGMATATGDGIEADTLAALQSTAEASQTGCFADPDANLNIYGTPDENAASMGASLAQASILPTDLNEETIVSGLNFPTSFSMFPDGRILIGEKSGLVRLIKDGVLQATPFIDIRSQVNDYWDRGLLKVAVDPDFENNNYVYLMFTYESDAGHFSGPKTGRLIRVTASGDTASTASAVTLLGSVNGPGCDIAVEDCIPSEGASHSTGGIAFGDDGSLFLTLGEGAGFNVVDPDALRAQDPDSLGGKLVRINNNGEGLADNPYFTGNPDDNRSKIWASGVRNAFRFSINPANGIPFVGDVGWTTWEEVSVAPAGSNLGWPCFEGPARQGGFENFSACQALYAQETAQPPLVYWNHEGGGSAVTGGVFLSGDHYPEPYQGAYVYADYVAGSIYYLHVDENNNLVSGPTTLADAAGGPVDFALGADGHLYYLDINSGALRRIVPAGPGGPADGVAYISDMLWLSEVNGHGPVERDTSNGEALAGDGNPLSIRGTVFEKGLGVHSDSEIQIDLNGMCPVFTAVVGVDDEVAPNGRVTFEVWGDDMLMYESDVLTGTSQPEAISVDLSGHDVLRLVTTIGDDNNWWDHANWADAQLECVDEPPPPAGEPLYISDLPWLAEDNAWGPAERDLSNGEDEAGDGLPLSIRGTVFEKGIGAHATSTIEVAIPELCPVFSAVLGVDDEVAPNGSVDFEVWADDMLMYESGVLTGTSDPLQATVDLTGHSLARLVIGNGGDNIDWDHGNWADAHFICSEDPGEQPPTVSIDSPETSYEFQVGDVLEFSGTATDSDGNAIEPSGYSWRVLIHHCSASDCHIHQLVNTVGVTSSSVVVPEHGIDPWYIELVLTVTQPNGAQATTAIDVLPQYVSVTLDSSPAGMQVSFGAVQGEAPLTRDIVAGSQFTIQAPSPQGEYEFVSWSDGGSQQHNVTLEDSDLTLTALFTDTSEPPPLPGEAAFVSDLPWVSEVNGWGPAERDTSNNEEAGGDGYPLTMGGVTYDKGIGVHATSEIIVDITALCPVFEAVIGIDDEVGPNGEVTFEVWGDSTLLFGSDPITGAMPGQAIRVDLTGYDTMRLVVDEGDINWWDHANWANARLVCEEVDPPPPPPPVEGDDTFVSDLDWTSEENAWGPAERDASNGEDGADDGAPLTMAGVIYDKGIGVHALAEIVVDVVGLCPYFHAVVGVDDEVGAEGSVRFAVYGDDTLLFQSSLQTGSSTPEALMVNLTGYATMRLVVDDGGDSPDYDHANWAFAVMSCSTTPPAIPDPEPDPDPDPVGLFGEPTSYDTGTNSHGVIAADVTGNGQLDMIVANAGSNPVSVFSGNGDGTFGSPTNLNVGGLAPKMVTAADINNDGTVDLLTANQDSNGIGILIGTGSGSFAPAVQISTCRGAHEVALDDLDGDGNLDIVTACWGDDHISLRLGNGDSTFQDAVEYYTDAMSHSVQIADFNGDGLLDLVADDYLNSRVHVFVGNGDGTFADSTTFAVGDGPHGIRVADLNNDGNLDVVTANDMAGTVSVLLGNGNSTFQPQIAYTVNPRPKSVAIGDVTGDGQLDIVVANTWGNYGASTYVSTEISVLEGTGGGNFAAAEHFAVDLTPFSVTIADFNGDGRNDVAAALWHSNTATVFLNEGN